MYSFGNRKDTHVIDEPLYPHFLLQTGVDRPDREETLAAHETRAEKVIAEQFLGSFSEPYLFLKHMPHHMIGVKDQLFIQQLQNIFLIRKPEEMITSYVKQVPNPTMLDMGLEMQWQLFRELEHSGRKPIVIDSRELLRDPESVLTQLCDHLVIPFDRAMLHWEPGPRKEDGIWAKYWYHSVHRSIGFSPYIPKAEHVPRHLQELLDDCHTYYYNLLKYTIKA